MIGGALPRTTGQFVREDSPWWPRLNEEGTVCTIMIIAEASFLKNKVREIILQWSSTERLGFPKYSVLLAFRHSVPFA